MGIGDEIMAAGEAKRQSAGNRTRFAIWDMRKGGSQRWHDMWEGNPHIARIGESYDGKIINHGGCRPYIREKGPIRWLWKAYAPAEASIYLTDQERSWGNAAKGRVIIQPNIKTGASPNKNWGLKRWQMLVDSYPAVPWLQIGAGSEPQLRGVSFLLTPSFRAACGVLSGARAAVLQEGGLHHAAAAFALPAVVIYGSFIAPACTGYAGHRNLFKPSKDFPLGCGMRDLCSHCVDAMASITPSLVYQELEKIL